MSKVLALKNLRRVKATEDLPEAMEPVKPSMIIVRISAEYRVEYLP